MAEDAASLAAVRRAHARAMVALATGAEDGDPRLADAFAAVPREAFLGPPPWTIQQPGLGGRGAEVSDPALLCADVLVVLDAARGANNGSPSFHALLLHRLCVREGDRVAHLGAGTGYYTAILARLAGPTGRVLAVEADPALARAARDNLAPYPTVEVVEGDAARHPAGEADRLYVNFGVGRPAARWVEALAPRGGRLVLPLGPSFATGPGRAGASRFVRGGAFLFERTGEDATHLAAAWLSFVAIIAATGDLATDGGDERAEALGKAVSHTGGAEFVRGLRWGALGPPERCAFWSPGWSLTYDPPPPGGAQTTKTTSPEPDRS